MITEEEGIKGLMAAAYNASMDDMTTNRHKTFHCEQYGHEVTHCPLSKCRFHVVCKRAQQTQLL